MKAKELIIEKWVNSEEGFKFSVKSNQIKVIHVFQMLCPGCVYRGIPQAVELYQKFNSEDVSIVGLHSVFENHYAMQPNSLDVFIKEWRLPFPVAIDKRLEDNWIPETMKSYHLQGTPSLIVIDHLGDLKLCRFGHVDQDQIESFIQGLIESKNAA